MYQSINPFSQEKLAIFDFDEIPNMDNLAECQQWWANQSIQIRINSLKRVAARMEETKSDLALLISKEMGKPVFESLYEIDKTLSTFDYYFEHAEEFLKDIFVSTNATESFVTFQPLGILLSVMPWNFPIWQVFRFAIPSLLSGNTTILKHSPNVPQCALAIQSLFDIDEMPKGLMTNVFLSNEMVAELIAHDLIAGVSFTGSERTGSLIASLAGKYIKKSVIELGGNDAFVVFDDADLDLVIQAAVKSRSINAGQACNGAKRFIVHENLCAEFIDRMKAQLSALVVGDPLDDKTQIGPLARPDLKEKVLRQINDTVKQGAKVDLQLSFDHQGNFVMPTLLSGVLPGMCAFEEEIFGPVWSVTIAKSNENAIVLANKSQYGLAASVWTSDVKTAKLFIPKLNTGNVFINSIVKSDARLPFGGVKKSGYGRELSDFGLKEFVNIKSVFIQ